MLSAQLLTLLSTSENMHHCMLRLTFDEKFWQHILTQNHFFFRWVVVPEFFTMS